MKRFLCVRVAAFEIDQILMDRGADLNLRASVPSATMLMRLVEEAKSASVLQMLFDMVRCRSLRCALFADGLFQSLSACCKYVSVSRAYAN